MFDRVSIRVKAGNGGQGSASFRHEKYVPFGGPDGGDGGDGGDVTIAADRNVSDLAGYHSNRLYRAENGGSGRGKKMHGRQGKSCYLKVPAGTVVFLKGEGDRREFLADLKEAGEAVLVARGGGGGWGNVHFVSPVNQTPEKAEAGTPGEEKSLVLEMRLIADAGIIGFPNAGKSTLLSRVSAARPRVADYPFTTREPVLGVVSVGSETFTLAEIPGLIEGAHLGRGLGHEFLRHAMRTRVFVHLIDGTKAAPVSDMLKLNRELELFNPGLLEKPQLVSLNKIDLPDVRGRMGVLRGEFREAGWDVLFISAETGEGVPELMQKTLEVLKKVRSEEVRERVEVLPVLRPGQGKRKR